MTDQLDTAPGHRTRPPRTWRSLRGHGAMAMEGGANRGLPMMLLYLTSFLLHRYNQITEFRLDRQHTI